MNTGVDFQQYRHPRRWLTLVAIYMLMFSFAITIQTLPPVLGLIISFAGLSHAQAGLLMSLFALSGVVVSIPAGAITDRYGAKKIGIAALVLMLIGVSVFVSSGSFAGLAVGRVLSGVGALTLLVLCSRTVPQWFAGTELSTAFGIMNTAVPLGLIVAFNGLSVVAQRSSWQTAAMAAGLVPLVALVFWAVVFKPVAAPSRRPQTEGFRAAFTQSGISIWLVGLTWMFFNGAVIAMFTFTPDLLKSAGFSLEHAGFVSSVVMWPGLVVPPIVGYLVGRSGAKEVFIVIGVVVMSLLMLFVPQTVSFAAGMMLFIGIAQNLVPPPVYKLASEVLPAHRHGLGYGIVWTCATAGMAIGPFLAGLARDVTGSYRASYAVMAAFGILAAVTISALWRVRARASPRPARSN